jgi:hypothetical protein
MAVIETSIDVQDITISETEDFLKEMNRQVMEIQIRLEKNDRSMEEMKMTEETRDRTIRSLVEFINDMAPVVRKMKGLVDVMLKPPDFRFGSEATRRRMAGGGNGVLKKGDRHLAKSDFPVQSMASSRGQSPFSTASWTIASARQTTLRGTFGSPDLPNFS